jgi:hypothetical protein
MAKTPIATPHTEGRTFGTDWSIVNVATLLRANAGRGTWHRTGATGGTLAKVNQNYIRTVSARHLPTSVSLIFMRLEDGNCWYASLCFADADDYLPWKGHVAERWLCALFGEDRPRVIEDAGTAPEEGLESSAPSARQFELRR